MADQEVNNNQNSSKEGTSIPPQQSQNLVQNQTPPQQSRDSKKINNQEKDNSEVSSSQDEKQEIVRQLFGDVGELKKDFSCAVESSILLHGRMYVTKKFLCFYSNLFGLEKKIRVPYSHISVISKENTALVIPNAISVTTFRKEYVFRSFWDRDDCYNLIKELVEEVKGTRGNTASSHEEANAASVIHNNTPKVEAASTSPHRSQKVATNDEYETEDSKRASVKATALAAVLKNPEEAFKLEMEKSKMKNETVPVVMSGNIEDFFNKFIADDAPFSYQKYQSETGDKDVETTEWKESSSTFGYTRDMRFLKPVAVPAKPYARALMTQRYKRFGDYGFTIASSTRMEDVPYCDFFTVEVLLSARTTGENELTMMAYYEVKFIQSTMFRRFIEGNTNPDVKKWNEDHITYIKENLCDAGKKDVRRKRSNTVKSSGDAASAPGPLLRLINSLLQVFGMGPLPVPEFSSQTVSVIAWVSIMFVFLYFAWQWRGVRNDLRAFDSRLQQGLASMEASGRHMTVQDEVSSVAEALRGIRRHGDEVVRDELKALKLDSTFGNSNQVDNSVEIEQFWDGIAQESPGNVMTKLQKENSLLAEHIKLLSEINGIIRKLDHALTAEYNTTEDGS